MGVRKNRKRRGWYIIAAAAALTAALVLLPSNKGNDVAQTLRPERGQIVQTASAYGLIRAVEEVTISPDVSGEIVELRFGEGDRVNKGDLLFKIKQESYLLAISRCEAALGSAVKARDVQQCERRLKELEYNQLKQLIENDAAPAGQLDQAAIALETAIARCEECECQIAVARSQLEAARSEMAKTAVYAPMSGTVTSLRVKSRERVVGTSTMAGTEIMTIADLDRMELVVKVGENDICNIKAGDKAQIKPDSSPDVSLDGQVTKMAVSASRGGAISSATDFEVHISIDSKQVTTLLPGMSASVVIFTGSKNDILTVPLQAIVIDGGKECVWTVDSKQQARLRQVQCGIQDFGRIEICSGLDESDLIVAGPYQLINKTLKEGDRINIGNDI